MLAALFQHLLELVADVKVVFNRGLAPAGNDDDLVAAGGHGLFHAVLNDGFIDDGQHLFGLRFSRGKKASA